MATAPGRGTILGLARYALMVDDPRKPGRGRMRSLLLILALCVLVLGLVIFAWTRNPPDTPNASSTAFPDVLPGAPGTPPPAR